MLYYNVQKQVQRMKKRLPYYMAYPVPLFYDDERMERQDFDYMKSMYPDMARKILPLAEDACEHMSYTGSMIFDEYPDQLQVRMMCNRIYEKLEPEEDQDEQLLREMVQLVLFQELHRCRKEYRKQKKQFYIQP